MERSTLTEELRLARRAAGGDHRAWDRIIGLYGDRIFSIALQFSSQREQAEDLTQEVFLRLFQNLSKYRGDTPLIAWTLRLSRNLCIDHYRRSKRERDSTFVSSAVLASLPSSSNPRRDTERRELLRQVRANLGEMREDLAMVVILRDLQGLSYAEISTLLALPVGTLKSRLCRARRELIGRLQKQHKRDTRPCAKAASGQSALEVAPC